MIRFCCTCGREITSANGFFVGRDFTAFIAGELAIEKVRELCGSCILLSLLITGEEELVEHVENLLSTT